MAGFSEEEDVRNLGFLARERRYTRRAFNFANPSTMNTNGAPKEFAPSIEVRNLTFAFPDGTSGLKDVILNLPPASRTLLIGG